MLPFIFNTFARFLVTVVATCTKGALPCRKETKKSLNGFVSETATMARSITSTWKVTDFYSKTACHVYI